MIGARKVFFAIPFDAATKMLYERVCEAVRQRYPEVTTVVGSKEVGVSPEYSDIVSFKVQNRDLHREFVRQIQEADIIIADLTHNNPNVHVELGMALLMNKNVLRVTGRTFSEIGFDVRNLEVRTYSTEKDLLKTVTDYCDLFLRIKTLPISDEHPELYFAEPTPFGLSSSANSAQLKLTGTPGLLVRDGAVRVRFELVSAETEDDWFGVYFRAGTNPFLGSHLVYIRKSGKVEVAVYPGPRVLYVHDLGKPTAGLQDLVIEFENNHVEVQLGSAHPLRADVLSLQAPGAIALASWNAEVRVEGAEMVCRDTIAWE